MRDWDLYFKAYYEEAIEALEEIGSILDYNTNARCKAGRRDLVSHVRHYKLNDGQYRRLYEQAQKDAEHFRGEANVYEAKWRAVLKKYEDIKDTDWYMKIKDQEKQIDDLKEENRKLKEDSQLTIKNGDTMLVRVRSYDELKRDIAQKALAVASLKTENDILKNKLKEIENIVNELK